MVDAKDERVTVKCEPPTGEERRALEAAPVTARASTIEEAMALLRKRQAEREG